MTWLREQHKRVHLSCEGCSTQVMSDFYRNPPVGWSQFGLSRFRGHEQELGNWCPACIAEGKHLQPERNKTT